MGISELIYQTRKIFLVLQGFLVRRLNTYKERCYMEQYEVAMKTKKYLIGEMENFFNEYIEKYLNDIGYLQFYPLILAEELYSMNSKNPMIVADEMYKLSWFVSNIKSKINVQQSCNSFKFNKTKYLNFKDKYFTKISNLYWVYKEIITKLDDIYSPVSLFLEGGSKEYKLIWPLISSPIQATAIYYYQTFDKEILEFENKTRSAPIQYIMSKIMVSLEKGSLDTFKQFDEKLYCLCTKCVEIDINKLGGRIRSSEIKSSADLVKFLSYFYYHSIIKKYNINSIFNVDEQHNPKDYLIKKEKSELIEELVNITDLSEGKINKLINYFIFEKNGSFNEFPLFDYNGTIYWCPFSWILNDFQFSIVNGHYFKNIEFQHRDKTISHSVVAEIENKFKQYSNLKVKTEFYYEYKLENKKVNSDIDVAILDEKNKTLLIIECKWKDNFYAIAGEEIITKVYRGLQKIYSDQIHKHMGYFQNNKESINRIFNNKVLNTNDIDIQYIVVDKRSQLFIDDMKLVPLFGLLYLAENISEKDDLNLKKLLNTISSFKTSIEYICNEPKMYNIDDDLKVLSEDLYF